VLVDISKDALQATTEFVWPTELHLPGYRPVTRPHAKQVREAARLIAESRRPVLYVGGGVIRARAAKELRVLAEMTGIPVVTTLMARGAFPDSHPQHLGMPGMHGTVAAVAGLQRSDLIVSLGARFYDRVTGNLESFAPNAKVVHADIDPAEIGKNRAVDVPIVGDAREVIADLIVALQDETDAGHQGDYQTWVDFLAGVKKKYPLGYDDPEDGTLAPQYVIERLGKIAGPDAVYVAGVGQHQMWATHFIGYERPNSWINSGGLGTMGYSVPAAMGAKVARPDDVVWSIICQFFITFPGFLGYIPARSIHAHLTIRRTPMFAVDRAQPVIIRSTLITPSLPRHDHGKRDPPQFPRNQFSECQRIPTRFGMVTFNRFLYARGAFLCDRVICVSLPIAKTSNCCPISGD
jgi:acetolactate synthase-1/2/3 large subunit